ncbi:MAG: ABC transporter substrate-binding protein [Streptosporangiaceae bacterium]
MSRRVITAAALCLLVPLLAAGCATGGSRTAPASRQSTSAQAGTGPYPVAVHAANGDVSVRKRPSRIVSLSPSLTEMLYAIGAGKQVVAVDNQSDYPRSAPRTKLSGFKPNVEAIAGYDPDLVVLSFDTNHVLSGLGKLSIPVYQGPAAKKLQGTYRQITQLGRLTGHLDRARHLALRMKRHIKKIAARAPHHKPPLTYYHELDPSLHAMTSKSFIGQVYQLAGLRNIADPADKSGRGFTQLSAEYVIEKNPDLIFLADSQCCGQSTRTVAKRPGWSHVTAVRRGNVFVLDPDISSRWGPRVVDFLRAVVRAVNHAETG